LHRLRIVMPMDYKWKIHALSKIKKVLRSRFYSIFPFHR
jgi:hypothetical protein